LNIERYAAEHEMMHKGHSFKKWGDRIVIQSDEDTFGMCLLAKHINAILDCEASNWLCTAQVASCLICTCNQCTCSHRQYGDIYMYEKGCQKYIVYISIWYYNNRRLPSTKLERNVSRDQK